MVPTSVVDWSFLSLAVSILALLCGAQLDVSGAFALAVAASVGAAAIRAAKRVAAGTGAATAAGRTRPSGKGAPPLQLAHLPIDTLTRVVVWLVAPDLARLECCGSKALCAAVEARVAVQAAELFHGGGASRSGSFGRPITGISRRWSRVARFLAAQHRTASQGRGRVAATSHNGKASTLLVAAGQLFSFGDHGDASTCLGYATRSAPGSREQVPPRLVDVGGGGLRIVSVSAVCAHAVAVTEGGALFSWGLGAGGRLGHDSEDDVTAPKRVEALARAGVRVVQAAAGGEHTAAVTAAGRLYTWGTGPGGLGRGSASSSALTARAEQVELSPRLVDELLPAGGAVVVSVGAGHGHIAAITADGRLFTFGAGRSGQLGHGSTADEPLPRQVDLMVQGTSLCAHEVSCGARHTLLVTRCGRLLSWGDGLPKHPTQLQQGVIHACASDWHSCAVTEAGVLYTIGHDKCLPARVRLAGVNVLAVATGPWHTAVLGTQKSNPSSVFVYTFGSRALGRPMLLTTRLWEGDFRRIPLAQTAPALVEGLPQDVWDRFLSTC
jgi:hypothetical protein